MKSICLYFQVHQPFRLKKYRFFNMGRDHHYLDEFANRSILRKVAERCYLPMNELLLKQLKKKGSAYKVAFSISGIAIEQFKAYAPEVLASFKALAKTGRVEFLAETYSHSLASLCCKEEFMAQVKRHSDLMESEFGQRPTVFRNTELIYSDEIGAWVAEMGYKAMLAEGAKHILGWKSPDFIYANDINSRLKLLLRNFKLSDDIAFRFSDQGWDQWPLTVEKYVSWLTSPDLPGEVVNLFMDYETFGEHQWAETGIFDFMSYFPEFAVKTKQLEFLTPGEVADKYQPVSLLHTPHAFSWADEERDVTAWLGNELQDEAFRSLYAIREKVHAVNDPNLNHVWDFMQTSDHFYYMATKWFSDGDVHSYFNPYDTPYEAFINYMNVFSDFSRQVSLKYEAMTQQPSCGAQAELPAAEKAVKAPAKAKAAAKAPAKKATPKKPAKVKA
ncbi:MAG: glycoside hydrolase family 57 protein [Rikenellaceae bacterium]|jgi:alpha-amylase|nr:glycoside hydrolase family 57 protein [Rikenellaceae bacterium]